MAVISFASPKGGVGKSTAALLLATGLAAAKATVTVIDGDPNRTVEGWASAAKAPGFEWLPLPSDDDIIDVIEEASARTQFVVVDLEGSANLAMARSMSRTDLVVIPLQASPVDARQASRAIKMVLSQGKELRRIIPFRMLFNRVSPAIATRDEREIRSQFQEAGIPAFKTALNERAAFRAMFTQYQSLWDLAPEHAANLEKAQENASEFVRELTQILRDLRNAEKGRAA